MLRFSKLLLVGALAISIGLHWALLQSVAWVGMVVSYSQSAPLGEALAKTFDGQHPCKLCKAVTAGKQSEKSQEFQKSSAKVDFFLDRNPVKIFPPVLEAQREWSAAPMTVPGLSPPTPPPRAA